MEGDQEKRAEADAVILLIDECGYREQPTVRRTWSLRGQSPVLRQEGSWGKLSVIGALGLHSSGQVEEHFTVLPHNAKTMDFVHFLIEVHKRYRKKIIVVWDRLRQHIKAEKVFHECECPWAEFYLLPSYAPDLNPVEGLWSCTKASVLANFAPQSLSELQPEVEAALEATSERQSLLRALFRGASLDPSPVEDLCEGQ